MNEKTNPNIRTNPKITTFFRKGPLGSTLAKTSLGTALGGAEEWKNSRVAPEAGWTDIVEKLSGPSPGSREEKRTAARTRPPHENEISPFLRG